MFLAQFSDEICEIALLDTFRYTHAVRTFFGYNLLRRIILAVRVLLVHLCDVSRGDGASGDGIERVCSLGRVDLFSCRGNRLDRSFNVGAVHCAVLAVTGLVCTTYLFLWPIM